MSETGSTDYTSTKTTAPPADTTDKSTSTEPGQTETAKALFAAQEQGYVGNDAADEAGGIEALRDKHREATVRESNLEGSVEPITAGGHPQDPTVSKSVGGGA